MKRALIPVAALAFAALVSGCSTVDRTVSAAQHGDWKCVGGTVAGLAVGGIAGHGIGAGTGRTLATVGGAAAGGYVGNQLGCN
ncbi:glycine zipper 2TM domain-containing protein [Plasticicumulans sp.]|uniref:glycine zipper 2TM domain-containing protein n=1 Tax=Plasticicumulans sp. TaxID=2307179 RepID=UPI002B98A9EB|nr:glycine zipper 2TM domain-containing protein [Plasticicumulans sp.]MBS0600578.1 glycine zipper 2TM domain-containing protein [Pseudomonadota bacterium]HNE01780.1 glycine zipper 2TM domain-containing protein [Plasticicumulans sp.]HNM45295.1 glycine zipper 2TM domain-containing protein [Plasticicumulans sp.]